MMKSTPGKFRDLYSGHSEQALLVENLILPVRGTWCSWEGRRDVEPPPCPITCVPWQAELCVWFGHFYSCVLAPHHSLPGC